MRYSRTARNIHARAVAVALLGTAAVALFSTQSTAQSTSVPVVGDVQTLGVAGQVNTAVQLASVGQTVAIVWTTRAPGTSSGDVMLAMSGDAGRTFGLPQRVNTPAGHAEVGGEQPPSVVLGSPEEIYVVWRSVHEAENSIVAAYSSDGGHSFAPSQPLHGMTESGFRGFQSAAVGTDGTLYVTWLDGRHADGPKRTQHSAPRQDVYQATWKPGTAPRETQVQDDVCFCCKTATVVDSDGTVSVAWRHIYPGSLRDIAFAQEIDGGFGPPIRVSEDHWELAGCPDDGPSLAVDQSGTAHLVWPTVVQEPSPAKRLFYASSADGNGFSTRLPVPPLGGDTMAHPRLALDERGRPVVAWDEIHEGQRKVALAYSSVADSDRLTFGAPFTLSDGERAQYPDVTAVPGGVLVAWTSGSVRDGSVLALRRVELP